MCFYGGYKILQNYQSFMGGGEGNNKDRNTGQEAGANS